MIMKLKKRKVIAAVLAAVCVQSCFVNTMYAGTTQQYFSYPMKLDFEDDYANWALGW